MPYGNVSRKRQKGIYLSMVACDMVEQLSIVGGKTESNVHEEAIRLLYMQERRKYEDAKISWNNILEQSGYVTPGWDSGRE